MFDLRPNAIEHKLKLRQPMYLEHTCFLVPWEESKQVTLSAVDTTETKQSTSNCLKWGKNFIRIDKSKQHLILN